MQPSGCRRGRASLAAVLGFILGAVHTAPAHAQDSPSDPAAQTTPVAGGAPDFLFGRPHGSIGVRGSWLFARADSDLFDFVQRQLTVDKKDFNTPMIGIDGAITVAPRLDVMVGAEFGQATKDSEYRDFVDNRLLPINQSTTLRQNNVSGSIRFNLLPRGQSVSRFAWIPRSVTPFVGAGGGAVWYRFEQIGDFVDFVDHSVFTDHFVSSGFTPSAHIFGGTDLHLYRILFLTVEGRYVWANAKLGNDFVDFDPIDLAGFRLSTGIHIMF
jgi:hypothetical protein